jgi:hypothetical protein
MVAVVLLVRDGRGMGEEVVLTLKKNASAGTSKSTTTSGRRRATADDDDDERMLPALCCGWRVWCIRTVESTGRLA